MRHDFAAEEQSLQEHEVRRNNSGENAPVNRKATENALPEDKRTALKRIVADRAEPFHVRSEAQRILDIGDVMPLAEFKYRCAEFFDSYSPVTPSKVTGR